MSRYSKYGQREHRLSVAQQHATSMEQLFANEIRQSVDNTKRYTQRSTFVQRRPANERRCSKGRHGRRLHVLRRQ